MSQSLSGGWQQPPFVVSKGGLPTATTYFKKHKISKGETVAQSLKERFDYGQNPDKTQGGGLISSYECDYMTADAEFLLSKAKYKAATGREQRRESDVLCYQIRQSFKPGEITPEEANKVGYETAMRWTKGKYAFFVATHTDRQHIHNHIYYNAVSLDYSRKYRNFLGSSFALRRLSDRVCLEHNLSVIQNPKLHSQGQYLHYGQWLGGDRRPSQKEQLRAIIDAVLTERPADLPSFLAALEASGVQVIHGRGGVLSFQLPGFARPARWRSSTLGDGYGPEAVQAVIDGTAPVRTPATGSTRPAPRRLNLIIDIQQRMAQGKGPGYERWAKIYNLKQMAAALQFLREYGLTDYDELAAKTDAAVDQEHALAGELRAVQEELTHTAALMGAVVQYAKTRPVFDGYKAAKYSKKYLAQHEAELADYREAKATMNDLLDGANLPKMDALKQKRRELTERKKALTAQYRAAQKEMRELVTAKGNIDHLINLTGGRADKEQTR